MTTNYMIDDLNIHDLYKDKFNLDNVCKLSKKINLGYSVLTYSVKGDINIGKIMRSCELLGCKNFIIYGNKCYDRRYTHGSQHYLNVYRYRLDEMSLKDIVEKFNVTPIFVEQGGETYYEPTLYKTKVMEKQPMFVFGNESEGIPTPILNQVGLFPHSFVLSLPQCGFLRSYNVSVSSGIILNDYYRYCMENCKSLYL